jgi:DNA-binding CsgD family transcriptional regulator
MSILRATGVAWEAEIAFSGALELLNPVLDLAAELPEPQRRALGGALALIPAVEVDRFAVCAATLRLLALAAGSRPLLLLVDDAQWLDTASLEALLFTARRVAGEPIGILFAVRDGVPSMLDDAGLPYLTVEPLSRGDTLTLAREMLGTAVAEAQGQRIHRVTGGYPLALLELGRLGDAISDLDAPLPVSRVVEQAYARDVGRCDAAVRDFLLVVAADDTGELAAILAAADRLGVDGDALTAAEALGLIRLGSGRVEFRHPLMRSAVYQGAEAGRRRAVHDALARSLSGNWQADRKAWHRAAAALGPDERVAHELEVTAQRTRARSGYAAAASALERAAHLTPDPEHRARRLVTAADALWHAGRGARAEELLSSALEQTAAPLLRAEVQARRGRLAHFRGDTEVSRTLIMDASGRALPHDERLALELAAGAVLPALCCGDLNGTRATATTVARLARRAHAALAPDISGQVGAALVVCGQLELARPYLQATVDAAGPLDHPTGDPQLLAYAADCLGWMGRYPEARALAQHAREEAREHGALAALAYAALHLTDYEIAVGDVSAAVASAGEAQRISRETGQMLLRGWSALYLALIAANQGAEERTRAYLAEVEDLGVLLWFNGIKAVPWVHGRLHLTLGDASAAAEWLEEAIGSVGPHANWVPWTASADLIEAYVRTGREAEAAAALAALEPQVQQPWAQAALARCRGLLTDEDPTTAFEASASEFARLCVPLEAARSRLCHGERLRRAGRRVEARVQLREAVAGFHRSRAGPWASRARQELRLTGEVVSASRSEHAIDELTPQELQVALTVASGLTNKQAAARLFLSTKTIEAHLHRAYRKLGIRSRDELGPLLEADDRPERAVSPSTND